MKIQISFNQEQLKLFIKLATFKNVDLWEWELNIDIPIIDCTEGVDSVDSLNETNKEYLAEIAKQSCRYWVREPSCFKKSQKSWKAYRRQQAK